jgi:molecular chaperone GrpE
MDDLEKKQAPEHKSPRLAVALYILNKKGEVLLIRSPKWNNLLVACGGHVEYGETLEQTIQREAKEEVGLDVGNPELLTVITMIDDPAFVAYNAHFVGLQYAVKLLDEKQEIKLEDREAVEYAWMDPAEAAKSSDVQKITRDVIAKYLVGKEKKTLFGSKKCKDCDTTKVETEEYKAGWMRAQADYKNLQREISEQRSQWAMMSELQILEEFIPVYDNFKLAYRHQTTDYSPEQQKWVDGIGYIMKQFGNILKTHGIEEIKTVGEMFNPEFHEAMSEEESDQPVHTIIREIGSGYVMKGKVIKVSKVIVAKKKE